jgi:hypothetical protein
MQTYLTEPLTLDEIERQYNLTESVKGVVCMELNDMLEHDLDSFLDALGNKLTGSNLLMDISYQLVGVSEDHCMLIEVTGDPSMIFDRE